MAPTNIYVPGAPSVGKSRRRIYLGSAGAVGSAARQFSSLIFQNFSNAAISYTQPARVRAYEPQRTQCVIQNLGSTILQIGYSPDTTNDYIYNYGNVVWGSTLNPGQEYRENGFSKSKLFVRPNTSGQAGAYSVYHEMNGPVGSGTPVTQNITAPALAVPAFKMLGNGAASRAPIGISKDRTTIYAYGTSSKTTLYKSTDGGQTYSTVVFAGTLPANIGGFRELDDGSALVFCQAVGGPGLVVRNANFATTPATGWTTVLTQAANAASVPYWMNFSFGNNDIVAGSGKYGFIAEYGGTVTTEADPCHGYFTSDYGATWNMVWDSLTNPITAGGGAGHTKCGAYDPYGDRLYITQDVPATNNIGATNAWIFYINREDINLGNINTGWSCVQLPGEWYTGNPNNFQFSSNNIGPYRDRIVFGADHINGQYIYPRSGRTLGTGFLGSTFCNRANSIDVGFWQGRSGPSQPALMSASYSAGAAPPTTLHVDGSNEGASWTQLFQATNTTDNAVQFALGPDTNGNVVFNRQATAFERGQIIPGVLGQMAQQVYFTGDGVTTAFSFPHYLAGAPPTANAYPNGTIDAALTVPVVTMDATNITLTFPSAPATATYQFALRYDYTSGVSTGDGTMDFSLATGADTGLLALLEDI